jgi:alpha-D-xyloside xylohydrolase
MAAALKGGLSASLSGFGYWSHDIGGFRGEPTTDVYVRWAQFGLLSSHARCHGTTPREPWAFGEEALDVFRRYARLRYRLLPYLYSVADETARTGLPTVRPLVLAYQDDPAVADLDDQFLLGPNLLVAPVFAGDTTRSVYLPDGEWVDWWTDERYDGGRRVEVAAPLDRLPLFVRAGGVVPMREATETVQAGTPAELDLRAVLPAATDPTAGEARRATFEFYDEDRDAVVDLLVEAHQAEPHEDDGPVVQVRVGETALERVGATVDGIDGEPARVLVNGSTPEWTYDADEDRLTVAPSTVT